VTPQPVPPAGERSVAAADNAASPSMRRVVVTGIGLVTPLGVGADVVWKRLVEGRSGIGAIQSFDVSDLPAKIAGQVPRGDTAAGRFNVDDWVPPKDQRKMDDFIIFALAAAEQAVSDAGWKPAGTLDRERTGVMIGSGIGGLPGITEGAITLHERGPRRLSPFFIPSNLINLASGHVSIRYGFSGPNHAVVTACSTGAHAIGDAARLIMWDDADVMVCGGAEAAVCRLGVAGFAAARALSTNFNDEPTRASRPWDERRDGFVMGEGAGILVLEALDHAIGRGAKIYAEVVGYGLSGDAHHITAPAEDGNGAYRAMRNALKRARLDPKEIDYINAHGTSTPLGDEIELGAVKRVFGDHAYELSMSSTKSSIGHLLGAAGSVEAIFSILAMRDGIVPPTLNLEHPSPGCDIDLVPLCAKERPVRYALSNSFGFGGTNASLIFGRAP
jgi:3-oxoacyl-[acyl-carrier-protein] synthase II